uniref:peptide chain release factor N(5)-glutamine methyltransferase n=1 Tax=Alistipes sp. TaxID=1872444 RepID=UPI004056EDD4
MTTRRELLWKLREAIEPLYGEREAEQIARMVLAERSGVGIMELLADPMQELQVEDIDELVRELKTGRPVQYILGHTEFCGLDLQVREGVLIPRPETEELVGHILQRSRGAKDLLDIGTGSGAIACALKRGMPKARVVGVDYSLEALHIAMQNAKNLALDVEFHQADALDWEHLLHGEAFDLIVSNPPYIPQQEAKMMRRNVTDFEPAMALFVPDLDPLCFYRAIARAARRLLRPEGCLWFEVHEAYAVATAELLQEEGFSQVEILYDLFDKPRMLWSSR